MGTNNKSDDIQFRPLERADIRPLCDLMKRTDATIDGFTSLSIYRAVMGDSLARGGTVVIIALRERRIVGYAIALIDRMSYWRTFMLRHPGTIGEVIFQRASITMSKEKKERTHREPQLPEYVSGASSGRSWTESSRDIAKIMHIAVDASSRHRGIGKELYKRLFAALAGRGVRRVDANIGYENIPSIRLHAATGWKIERAADNLFASIDIA